jgi:uncharacterized delta-60 repeat protein
MITARPFSRERFLSLLVAGVIAVGGAIAQNGTLDVTFSGDGQYGFMPQIPDVITFDILETGGTIFPILSAVNGNSSSYIMKLSNDGSFDNGFDADGILEFPNITFYDAALAHDETRIFILAAAVGAYQICSIDLNGAVVGAWTTVPAPYCPGLAKMLVDDQGRICIGKGATINGDGYGQVIRLNEDFTVDNSFGSNGMAYTPVAPFSYPLMEIDGLGRIVLASYGSGSVGIWRFNADGTNDTTFNYTLDLSMYSLDNWILDIAIAHDNSIYVQPNTWAWPSYLFKLHEDGSLDTGFGTGGYMDLSDTDPNYYTAPDELLIEPNGGLIVLAQAYGTDGYMSGKYLTRLDEFGVLDPDFNPGIQPIDDNGYDLRINFHCATLQDDGKVLSMDQVVKWQNGSLFGYAPLITRFNNEKGAVTASVNDAGPRVDEAIAFPNPTNGPVALRTSGLGTWQNATAFITNNVGAMVMQEQLVNERIDLSALPAGVYYCLVKHAGGSLHARIVKE